MNHYCNACGRDDTPTKHVDILNVHLCAMCISIPYTMHFNQSERLMLAIGSVLLDELKKLSRPKKKLNRTKQSTRSTRRSRR